MALKVKKLPVTVASAYQVPISVDINNFTVTLTYKGGEKTKFVYVRQ